MKLPTMDACYLGDIAIGAGVTVNWIEKAISRKLFTPSNRTIAGRSRIYNVGDATRLATMSVLAQRFQLPLEVVALVGERMRRDWELLAENTQLQRPSAPTFLMLAPREPGWEMAFFVGKLDGAGGFEMSYGPLKENRWGFGAVVVSLTEIALETGKRLADHLDREELLVRRLKDAGQETGYDDVEE